MTPEDLEVQMARATRPRRTVPIVLDGDLRQRIEDLHAELDALEPDEVSDRRLTSRRKAPARVAEIDAALAELYEQADRRTLHVVIEGLAGTPWRALVAQHKAPVDAGGKPVGAWLYDVNRESLEEPLIRACVVGHRTSAAADEVLPLDEAKVDWLLDFASVEQRETLFLAAWAASRGDDAVPLRRPRSTTPRSDSA